MDRLMLQAIAIIIIIPLVAFWFWMLWNMTNNTYLSQEERFNWTVALIFLSVFAALWYYFVEYRNRHL